MKTMVKEQPRMCFTYTTGLPEPIGVGPVENVTLRTDPPNRQAEFTTRIEYVRMDYERGDMVVTPASTTEAAVTECPLVPNAVEIRICRRGDLDMNSAPVGITQIGMSVSMPDEPAPPPANYYGIAVLALAVALAWIIRRLSSGLHA